jgi:hypothetical protein
MTIGFRSEYQMEVRSVIRYKFSHNPVGRIYISVRYNHIGQPIYSSVGIKSLNTLLGHTFTLSLVSHDVCDVPGPALATLSVSKIIQTLGLLTLISVALLPLNS